MYFGIGIGIGWKVSVSVSKFGIGNSLTNYTSSDKFYYHVEHNLKRSQESLLFICLFTLYFSFVFFQNGKEQGHIDNTTMERCI